jgi:hypothetical protein
MFNPVVDVFTRILIKVATKDYITGFMDSLYLEGIINLQYVDDTLLFLKHGFLESCYLKWLMICFEQLSGMKINYNKSYLIPVNLSEQEIQMYSRTFCCKVGNFSIKYLGVPLHHEKLKREDIQTMVDKTINRIPGWQGRLMSYGARLALLKACLVSIPIYSLSVIKFPKWAIEAINSQIANFFWDDSDKKHKYHLSNWGSLTQRKEMGSLGIPDLRDLNLCLLAYRSVDTRLHLLGCGKYY